jgi:hypothetical protein
MLTLGDVTECPFSTVPGTQISSYDCNPVFSNTNEDWSGVGSVGFYATEVLGHAFYQMWYTSSGSQEFGDFGIGYAVSSDGTNWNTHPNNPLFENDPTAWGYREMVIKVQPILPLTWLLL